MKTETYTEMKERQRIEVNLLPIEFAFSNKQFEKAKAKLGIHNNGEMATFGSGSIIRKSDEPVIMATFNRHTEERKALLKDMNVLEDGFVYEMSNHEFSINSQGVDDVLRCFDLTEEEMEDSPQIKAAFERARKRYWEEQHD
jgi:hypothetical protein